MRGLAAACLVALACGVQAQALPIRIGAQPLAEALLQLGEQADLNIVFSPDLVRGRQAPPVAGQFSAEQALRALLQGSGIGFQREGRNLRLSPAGPEGVAQLAAVRVSADAVPDGYVALSSGTGKLLDTPLVELPRSVSVVTREQLRTQAPQSIERALAYTPGVQTDVSGSADLRMSGAVIRGFSDGSAYYKDGLKLLSAGTYASWNDSVDELERIEVLKGPASVLFGQGRPGGVVNVLSKRPSADMVNSIGLRLGSYDRREVVADVGGAVDEGGKVLYRLNLSGREAHGRNTGSRDDRLSVAPALHFQFTPQTRLTLLGSYSRERGTPKSWWPSLFTYPQIKDLPRRRPPRDPGFDRFDRDTHAIGYALEHATEAGWHLVQNLRYSEIDVDYRHIYAMDVKADGRSVTRGSLAQRTHGKSLAVDTRAWREMQWGALRHTFTAGVDFMRYRERDGLGFGWDVPDLDMYAPVYGPSIVVPALEFSRSDLRQTGIYTLNQLQWGRWIANVSLRRDRVRNHFSNATQPQQRESATTGSVGLLYLLDSGLAPYASYSTAFDPITGVKYDGSGFAPRKAKQVEVGLKFQPAGSQSLYTLAVFDIRQTNVTTPDPLHPRFSVQTGEVRATGVELEARFALDREWSAMLGYTYLNPRTTRSNREGEVGRQTLNTARQTASLWLDYRPQAAPGLMLAGGVRYRGKAPHDARPQGGMNVSPAFTLVDLAIAYETERYRVGLNVNNVFDKKYFTGLFRGMEREALLSLNYYW